MCGVLEVFVVLLVIKILMFLLFQVTDLVRRHKTRKDKYYVNHGSPSWKSLSALSSITGAVVHDGIYLPSGFVRLLPSEAVNQHSSLSPLFLNLNIRCLVQNWF